MTSNSTGAGFTGWVSEHKVIAGLAALILVGIIAGAVSGGSKTPTASSPVATATDGATTPAVTPAAVTPAATRKKVPNYRGEGLQAARDDAQKDGFSTVDSHDASGSGRTQILDSNWKVCDQRPAAGVMASTGRAIDFGAVKIEESCPGDPAPTSDGPTPADAPLDLPSVPPPPPAAGSGLKLDGRPVCTPNPYVGSCDVGVLNTGDAITYASVSLIVEQKGMLQEKLSGFIDQLGAGQKRAVTFVGGVTPTGPFTVRLQVDSAS